jgi:hypothetical protein
MTEKKLITFNDEQVEGINNYAEKYKKTFTAAVRILIDNALKQAFDENQETAGVMPEDSERISKLEEMVQQLSWWEADDGASRLGNVEVTIKEMQKSINVLTAASKLFKAHLKDRSIHLQD